MDRLDQLQAHLDALEHHLSGMSAHTRVVEVELSIRW